MEGQPARPPVLRLHDAGQLARPPPSDLAPAPLDTPEHCLPDARSSPSPLSLGLPCRTLCSSCSYTASPPPLPLVETRSEMDSVNALCLSVVNTYLTDSAIHLRCPAGGRLVCPMPLLSPPYHSYHRLGAQHAQKMTRVQVQYWILGRSRGGQVKSLAGRLSTCLSSLGSSRTHITHSPDSADAGARAWQRLPAPVHPPCTSRASQLRGASVSVRVLRGVGVSRGADVYRGAVTLLPSRLKTKAPELPLNFMFASRQIPCSAARVIGSPACSCIGPAVCPAAHNASQRLPALPRHSDTAMQNAHVLCPVPPCPFVRLLHSRLSEACRRNSWPVAWAARGATASAEACAGACRRAQTLTAVHFPG